MEVDLEVWGRAPEAVAVFVPRAMGPITGLVRPIRRHPAVTGLPAVPDRAESRGEAAAAERTEEVAAGGILRVLQCRRVLRRMPVTGLHQRKSCIFSKAGKRFSDRNSNSFPKGLKSCST